MKNLNVIQTAKLNLSANIIGQCIDSDNKRYIVLTEDLKVFEVSDDPNDAKPIEHNLQQESATIKPEDVILIEYIVESGSVCVVLKDGRFICIGVSSFSPPSDCVYTHARPISSAKFSSDQDLIALADYQDDVFILTADFMVMHSSNALTHNDSVHKPVGVGWGSKETQFFGLDGRPSKEKQSKDQVTLGDNELTMAVKIEACDMFRQSRRRNEKCTTVDWRGDGQLLATFTYIPETDKHYLKVWNRNLELQYMSEQLVTMERGLLSWIPNGQYVCTAQRRENRINEIAMFEKNGMVHQRITLPTFIPHLYIQDLLWSPDSKILAIVVVKFSLGLDDKLQQQHMIFLYTMQNFHYYLKYSSHLTFGQLHYSLRWDPIHNNILYISSENGNCIEYNCTATVDYCHKDTTVAVIDANKINLTPFTICNIPPPMSAMTIELDTLINRVVMHPNVIDHIHIITMDDRVIFFNSFEGPTSHKLQANLETKALQNFQGQMGHLFEIKYPGIHKYQNFTVIDRNVLIATKRSGCDTELVKLDICRADRKMVENTIKVIEGKDILAVVRESFDKADNSLILILDDFSCIHINLDDGVLNIRFSLKTTADRLHLRETQFVKQYGLVMTLTLDATLRANEQVVVSNCCTSFKTTDNFLIYTTTENMIHFVPLDRLASSIGQDDLGSWNQPIENGGTLTVASESDSKVILQMPRGNLEILHPRIMVLLRIINHLDQDDYLSALQLARRFRVDLNFLADYKLRCDEAEFFSQGIGKFANTIHDETLLNLFIAELNQDDTTRGRYESAMKFLPASDRMQDVTRLSKQKVNDICSAIIQHELAPEFLHTRLLCLLKQEPSKTGEALELIFKDQDKLIRETALKFILYFVNIEQLFNDAISTYDTDIAIMVAGVSSKDPKEYLALLESFNKIKNEDLRRYHMDMHIKNYEKAYTNLLRYHALNVESNKKELLDLVVSKRIYRHAIYYSAKFEGDRMHDFRQELWSKYGEYLLEKRYYLEAGIAFKQSLDQYNLIHTDLSESTDNKLEQVTKCYLLANEWERCLAVLEMYEFSPGSSRKEAILKSISNNLMLQGDVAESIMVRQPYKDKELAFNLASQGNWHLAQYVAPQEVFNFLRKLITNSVVLELQNLDETLRKNLTEAQGRFERLKILLLTPPKVDYFDPENCYTADSLSTVDGSETSSMHSGSRQGSQIRGAKGPRSGAPSIKTRASTKSNKSQASQKKKKINLKEGSRHEDIALVVELKKFITSQKSNQETVRNLIALNVELDFKKRLDVDSINKEGIKKSFELARNIRSSLWPKSDQEENVYSLYNRFGKSLNSGEYIDNLDLEILMRPDLPENPMFFELCIKCSD